MPAACADELAAVEFMEKHRWGDVPGGLAIKEENQEALDEWLGHLRAKPFANP